MTSPHDQSTGPLIPFSAIPSNKEPEPDWIPFIRGLTTLGNEEHKLFWLGRIRNSGFFYFQNVAPWESPGIKIKRSHQH